jgi:hypothetical protein
MNVVSEWEIENLAAYLGLSKDGSINFHDFGKKMEQSGETLINSKSLEKSGEWPRATQLKKTIINDSKFAGNMLGYFSIPAPNPSLSLAG